MGPMAPEVRYGTPIGGVLFYVQVMPRREVRRMVFLERSWEVPAATWEAYFGRPLVVSWVEAHVLHGSGAIQLSPQ